MTINDSTSPTPNAIDDTRNFVRQQYHDFLKVSGAQIRRSPQKIISSRAPGTTAVDAAGFTAFNGCKVHCVGDERHLSQDGQQSDIGDIEEALNTRAGIEIFLQEIDQVETPE